MSKEKTIGNQNPIQEKLQKIKNLYDKYLNNAGPSMDEIAGVWDEENDNPSGHPWERDNEK